MHEPAMFPEPDTFRPERFLETHDPRLLDFDLPLGFGRRICVGLHLARASLFITVSRILCAFDILPARGETGDVDGSDDTQGEAILPDRWSFTNGFNSKPVSFPCVVKARDMRHAQGVEREWEVAKERLGKWQ